MNDFATNKIKWKHQICKTYKKSSHIQRLFQASRSNSVVSEIISIHKDEYQNYTASRLNDPKTNAKTDWSVLKSFTMVLPINNKPISDFEVNANYFVLFFHPCVYP